MTNKKISLIEIAKVFLTIGTIGFGGGLAIISLMQEYCVNQRKWLEVDEFLHGIALGQFLGPYAVNAAIFIGYRVGGVFGAMVALISFLSPSVIFVIILSALYVRFNTIPSLQSALLGIGPIVLALIFSAAVQMGKYKIKSVESAFLMIMAIFLSIFLKFQVVEILLIALIYGVIKIKILNRREGV